MFAARRLRALGSRRMVQQRRSAQTVPHLGSTEAMEKEALQQIKARVDYQKRIINQGEKSHAEEVEEMYKWIKISFMVAFPICVLSSFKDLFFGDHPHPHEGPEPDYMKIRNKAYPWDCEDCNLFDNECWKQCRAEMAAGN